MARVRFTVTGSVGHLSDEQICFAQKTGLILPSANRSTEQLLLVFYWLKIEENKSTDNSIIILIQLQVKRNPLEDKI